MISEHGRSAVAHVSVGADAGWETMPIPPDCERVPSASVVAGSPDTGRETMPIPPDWERVPDFGVTAGVTDVGWETISIPPDQAHIPGAGAPGPDRETMPIPSDCERVAGNEGDAGDPFFVRFCIDDGILVEVRSFLDERRLRRAKESLASDLFDCSAPAVYGTPLCWKRIKYLGVQHTFGGTRLGSRHQQTHYFLAIPQEL